jgi:hypothetical protein
MGAIDGIRMIRSHCLLSDGKSALPSLLRIFLIIRTFFIAYLEAGDLDFEMEGRISFFHLSESPGIPGDCFR